MMNYFKFLPLLLILMLTQACEKSDTPPEVIDQLPDGVFILNQGTFTASNATLSYYETESRQTRKEIFYAVNQVPLGDVGQSITIHGDRAYLVINNSGLIHVINRDNGELTGTIEVLVSPRYLLIINEEKGYVSNLFSGTMTVVNPKTFQVTGSIDLKGRSSERMAQVEDKVFVANWSGLNQEMPNNLILVIDSQSDQVVDSIAVGIEPAGLVVDRDDFLWVMTTGGFNPQSKEPPALWKIDPSNNMLVDSVIFPEPSDYPAGLEINRGGDTLLILNDGVYVLETGQVSYPSDPFIPQTIGKSYEYLAVDPVTGEIYVSDPLDYVSPGIVYIYSPDGKLLNTITGIGIVPAAYGFNY